jgi:hypothetical protein
LLLGAFLVHVIVEARGQRPLQAVGQLVAHRNVERPNEDVRADLRDLGFCVSFIRFSAAS